MEKLPLIDFSTEDDFLVASNSPGNSVQDFRLSESMEDGGRRKSFKQFVNAKSATEIFDRREERVLVDSKRATNSRESLAWDSAFFTNAGVLDPDELFTMNKGFEKAEARKRKSTYSEFVFDADDFFIESDNNIDDDIFQDIRASISNSSFRTNMFSEDHRAHISKKPNDVSEARVEPIQTARKQNIHKQASDVKGTTSSLTAQISAKNGLKSYSPKPPQVSGKTTPISSGSTRTKHKPTTSSSGKGLVSSRKSRVVNSSSCYSVSSYNNASSPFNCSRARADSRKNKVSSSSIFKTPLRCSLQVENELRDSNSSNRLPSFLDHCSRDSIASFKSPLDRSVHYTRGINGNVSVELTRNSLPSSLRMPSPKIGFFDEEHSSAHYQFHLGSHSASPQTNGITPKRRSVFSRLSASKIGGLSPSTAPSAHSERKKSIERKSSKPTSNLEKKRLKKDLQGKNEHLPPETSPLEENKKENLSGYENHIDGLSRCLEGINLNKDTTIELRVKKCGGSNGSDISSRDQCISSNALSKPRARARTPLAVRNCGSIGRN